MTKPIDVEKLNRILDEYDKSPKLLRSMTIAALWHALEAERQSHQQALERQDVESRLDELHSLIDKTKCHRPDCRTEHKVKRADIDDRIAELNGRREEIELGSVKPRKFDKAAFLKAAKELRKVMAGNDKHD